MLYDQVPPVSLPEIRARVERQRRQAYAKWSAVGVSIVALIVIAFGPLTHVHHAVPVPATSSVPVPQPTVT
ncbi:MAG: hypothetical protein NVSMB31_02530 [Vulcanimicrobiaceae bacterium]